MSRHDPHMTQDAQSRLTRALDTYQASCAMAGDRQAFELLYKRWHPKLLRLAYRLTGHPEEAQDVMQEAAMAIARNIGRLDAPDRFAAWAYTIVRRRAADQIKRTVRRRDALSDLKSETETAPARPDPAGQALADALSELAPTDQTLLRLFYLDGFTGPELAAAMGLPLGTVKSRLFAARQRLKSTFEATEKETQND